jgi:uncharacterized SAM-binding protein YcdF (DUF218 family)
MFLFKKIVAPLFFPVPLCLGLLLLGLFLLWFTRRQRAGKLFVTLGVALLFCFTQGTAPRLILRPLEYRYAPLMSSATEAARGDLAAVRWIVVLGGGHTSDPALPATSQIEGPTLARLVEGIRLHRLIPGSRLLLSGGQVFDPVSNADIMAQVARALGVSPQDIVLEKESRDTEDEARIIRSMIGDEKFIMVTSASHMPRAMALFTKLGMRPIPAPTDHLTKESQGTSPGDFYPSAEGLRQAERAFYEYLGLAWARLRGRI